MGPLNELAADHAFAVPAVNAESSPLTLPKKVVSPIFGKNSATLTPTWAFKIKSRSRQDRQCDHFASDTGARMSSRSRFRLPCSRFQRTMGSMETERLGDENLATGEINALDE